MFCSQDGCINVINAAKKAGIKRFLLVSEYQLLSRDVFLKQFYFNNCSINQGQVYKMIVFLGNVLGRRPELYLLSSGTILKIK